MATWNSRGLRGSTLEEFINHTNNLDLVIVVVLDTLKSNGMII